MLCYFPVTGYSYVVPLPIDWSFLCCATSQWQFILILCCFPVTGYCYAVLLPSDWLFWWCAISLWLVIVMLSPVTDFRYVVLTSFGGMGGRSGAGVGGRRNCRNCQGRSQGGFQLKQYHGPYRQRRNKKLTQCSFSVNVWSSLLKIDVQKSQKLNRVFCHILSGSQWCRTRPAHVAGVYITS